jgi:hypothetical protein
MSIKHQQVEWRRDRVLELSSRGHTQADIASLLQVDKSLICKDIAYLRRRAQDNLQHHIHEIVPEEYQKAMVGMKHNLKRVLEIADSTTDSKLKLQASSIANECYRDIMDLCTNAGIVSDALKFVESKTEKLISDSSHKQSKEIIDDQEITTGTEAETETEEETETDTDTKTETDIETEGVF